MQNRAGKRACWLYERAIVDYRSAWLWQQQLQQERIADPALADAVIMLEHPPVYTLGTGASLEFVKFAVERDDCELYRVERGGEVTYHCPGQIVVYPILNLKHYRQDLHWYLRQLEEVIVRVLARYDLAGERVEGLTGVWVADRKVAAIGIKASKWVTMHGFALNVCPDLRGFERIVPCGIADRAVGSMAEFIPDLDLATVRSQIASEFAAVFQVEWLVASGRELAGK